MKMTLSPYFKLLMAVTAMTVFGACGKQNLPGANSVAGNGAEKTPSPPNAAALVRVTNETPYMASGNVLPERGHVSTEEVTNPNDNEIFVIAQPDSAVEVTHLYETVRTQHGDFSPKVIGKMYGRHRPRWAMTAATVVFENQEVVEFDLTKRRVEFKVGPHQTVRVSWYARAIKKDGKTCNAPASLTVSGPPLVIESTSWMGRRFATLIQRQYFQMEIDGPQLIHQSSTQSRFDVGNYSETGAVNNLHYFGTDQDVSGCNEIMLK